MSRQFNRSLEVVKPSGPSLTQAEREKAAYAAAVIVTRCPMAPNEGFVWTEGLLFLCIGEK